MAAVARSPLPFLLLMVALPAAAQVAPPPDAPGESTSTADPAAAAGAEVTNGCRGEPVPDATGLDTMRSGLQRGVCSTARFVDRLFGGEHEYSEVEDDTNGRAGLTFGWNELDEFEVDTRLRASVTLPAINERFNATIGRASRDEYVADELATVGPVVGAFSDDQPAEWFAGLGYRVFQDRDSRFDLGAGIKLETPLNPYVNARFRHYVYVGDDVLLSFRTTAFVENDEGFGVTQAFDLDRVMSPDYLLRFANSVRMSEGTEGIRWRTRLALYQTIDYRRAMRYEISMRGETDGTQPDLYGLRVTHRRSMFRDWFFVEYGGALFWADGPLPSDRCNACFGASIGFEFMFGDAYDRALQREARDLEADGRD
ncbi:MAG: hypothetical protein WD929_04670 [Steroidobacteraceae bacterium]